MIHAHAVCRGVVRGQARGPFVAEEVVGVPNLLSRNKRSVIGRATGVDVAQSEGDGGVEDVRYRGAGVAVGLDVGG